MENNHYILTLDYGTQSARALIIDQKGEILASKKIAYSPTYNSPQPGWFEQDADFYFNTMSLATRELRDKYSDLMDQVCGVVATHFRDTAVLLDKDLKPIRPAILWLDQRVAKPVKKFPLLQKIIFTAVGMREAVFSLRAKLASQWYEANEPENWKKTHKYVNISTYLNYCLTNELKDTPSNQTGHYPMNFKTGKWYKKPYLKSCIFNFDQRLLCELVPSGSILGHITEEAAKKTGIKAGLPLIASGTDKSSESIGTGCLNNDVAAISYGTASTIEVTTKKHIEPELFLPCYQSAMRGYFNMEVQIYRGYWMLNWFKEEFGKEEALESDLNNLNVLDLLNKKMLTIPPGSDGLLLQPYWGPSLKKPNAKGAIIGFSEHHTRLHLYRAIVEGIAYALRDALEGMQKRQHKKVKLITISGGGSSSDAICQITADIFGLPTVRVQTLETASLGSAIVGFVALGIYSSHEEAIQNIVHYQTPFIPNLENHSKYNFLFNRVYKKMYPKLKRMYRNLRIYSKNEVI